MFGLLTLGFILSLDNFRSSLVLGGLKPTFPQSVKTSAIFGLWDGVAPVFGILVGHILRDRLDNDADTVAMIGLGVYGVFLIIRAIVSPNRADPDLKWARFGLPVPKGPRSRRWTIPCGPLKPNSKRFLESCTY